MARNAYTLDGIPLVHPQLKYFPTRDTGIRVLPAKRSGDHYYPGVDGQTFSPGATFVPGSVRIQMYVEGVDHEDYMENLEFVNGLFLQRHKLLDLRHDYNAAGTEYRVAQVSFTASSEPRMFDGVKSGISSFIGEIPRVFWRSGSTVDATTPTTTTSASTVTLTSLSPGNAPIIDALIRVKGGFSTMTLKDDTSGHTLVINQALTSSEYIIIDTANWTARKVTSDTWSGGTNVDTMVVSSRGLGPMLTLEPQIVSGALAYRLTHSATNISGAPSVTVRAKRSFL